jgi:RNA polymerase sigma-70 factor (ECF subfamily)
MVTFLKKLCLNLVLTSYKLKKTQNFKNLSDEDLVKSIVKNNDTMLFEVLYDRFSERVYNKCLGFSRDREEAQDLAQDVFLKLFVKLSSFKGNSKFSTWSYAFTYNHCVNYVNRNTAKKIERNSVSTDQIEDKVDDIEDESMMSFKAKKLKKALELISAEDKMILLMKYQDSVTIKELVNVLDIGESAVKMRLKRAKEKLITVYENVL